MREPFDLDINDCVQIDPDSQLHYLKMLAQYHDLLDHLYKIGHLEAPEYGDLLYSLGNIEGRLFCDCCTLDDVEVLSSWEQELEIPFH